MEKEILKTYIINMFKNMDSIENVQCVKDFDLFVDEFTDTSILKNSQTELLNILNKYVLEDMYNKKIVKYVFINYEKLNDFLLESQNYEKANDLLLYYNLIKKYMLEELLKTNTRNKEDVGVVFKKISDNTEEIKNYFVK